MKKTYTKPQMEVVMIQRPQILSGSPVNSASGPFNWTNNFDEDDN